MRYRSDRPASPGEAGRRGPARHGRPAGSGLVAVGPSGRRSRRAAVATLALVAAITAGCGGGADHATTSTDSRATTTVPAPAGTLSPTDPVAYAAEIVEETNRARADEGLQALTGSACAEAAALPRAEALVGRPDLEHAPMEPVLAECAPHTTAAENLSRAAATPAEIVDAWLGSYGHRENLLDPALTDVGVACLRDDDAMLCAQIFLGP
jgi:uncharacterized protein YkwD